MNTISRQTFGGNLKFLNEGGEGAVYLINSTPGHVFKEYLPEVLPTIDIQTLKRLVGIESALPPQDWERIKTRSAWPSQLVTDGTRTIGFTMAKLDSRFYRKYGLRQSPSLTLCEWNHIVHQHQPLGNLRISEVPRLNEEQILKLLLDLAKTIETIHRSDLIIGDLSGKNLIWSIDKEPEVHFIDCDSFRFTTSSSNAVAKQTVDYIDPTVGGELTNQQTDVYKFGIAAFRALSGETSKYPAEVGVRRGLLTKGDNESVASLIEQSTSNDQTARPSMGKWVSTLDERITGRTMIRINGPSAPGHKQPEPPPAVEDRPKIRLRPSERSEQSDHTSEPQPDSSTRPTVKFPSTP